MPRFTFRIRLPKARSSVLVLESKSLEWSFCKDQPSLILSSGGDIPLTKAKTLYFKSDNWPDEESARAAAARYVGALARTFARLRVGVDFGARTQVDGGLSSEAIDAIHQEQRVRVINEAPGVMVFETYPEYLLCSSSVSTLQLEIHAEQFERIFSTALLNGESLQDEESVSITLFNASFFENSQDARFMMLMMALEALIRPAVRSDAAIDHIELLIKSTTDSAMLAQQERDSLCGALSALKRESIGQAGRSMVRRVLGSRKYCGMTAVHFFSHCYSLRSLLVHGSVPLPTGKEVSSAAASLEVMMSDLLAGQLRDEPLVTDSD